jgi:glycine cleavage system H lipoate-binding protein
LTGCAKVCGTKVAIQRDNACPSGNRWNRRLNFRRVKKYNEKISLSKRNRIFAVREGCEEAKEAADMKKEKEKKENSKKKRLTGFRVVEDECIWMKAGVINFRFCDNAYDCYTCPFDKGMQRAMSSGEKIDAQKEEHGWVEHLIASHPGSERPCRYALTGHIDAPKICPMNYECYHCAFDQMMDDLDFAQVSTPPRYALASGYKMADGYYYHTGHCWVRFEHGGRVRVGFDDFMVRLFGRLKSLTLPPLGSELKKDQESIIFARKDHKAASLSPVTGTVLAVNQNVREHPEITHEDPFYRGWLYVLEPNMPKKNLKGLYYGKESMQWMEQESRKLLNLIGPEYERLASTGAEPISDVFGNFPELGWDQLVKTFLQTGI